MNRQISIPEIRPMLIDNKTLINTRYQRLKFRLQLWEGKQQTRHALKNICITHVNPLPRFVHFFFFVTFLRLRRFVSQY